MSLHRTQPWLAIWALAVLVVAPAHGQGMQDMQAFAPAEIDQFGDGARADEGFFFSLEGLSWWIQRPQTDAIGSAGMQREAWLTPSRSIIQTNTADTSGITSDAVGGTRVEFGYIHGHDGFLFSYFNLGGQNQNLYYGHSDVVFDDQPTGSSNGRLMGYVADLVEKGDPAVYLYNPVLVNLPISFDELTVKNRVKTWGTELEYVYRGHAGPKAGIFEMLMGARYLQFDERFSVTGTGDQFIRTMDSTDDTSDGTGTDTGTGTETTSGTPIAPGTILADSTWWSSAQNHVIGPQIGLRWFRQTERWTWEAEGRFFAGLNIQNLRQGGTLGSKLDEEYWTASTAEETPGVVLMQPLNFHTTSFIHSSTEHEWSPGVELRFDLKYQLTRGVAVKLGWTGIWVDGIARASNLVDYTLNETSIMGIDTADNRQSVFMHGVTFGVDVNR